MRFHWFLPTTGDGHQVRPATTTTGTDPRRGPARAATLGYLTQVARAAEDSGFGALLTPVGAGCPDPLVVCTALAQHTQRIKLLVAFRPGFTLPTVFAQQTQAFQALTGDRLLLNAVTGGDPQEQRGYGDFLDHDARYARTAEYLRVLRGSWAGAPFDFAGTHYRVEGGGLEEPLAAQPEIYFGGASPAAEKVAAAHADVYLMWGEPPAAIAARVDRIRAAAAAEGRTLRLGIRLHVIARDTSEEAWGETGRLLAQMKPEQIAAAQARFARMDSVGQQRMAGLHNGHSTDLEIAPNLWAGVGLIREGAGTALVGSYAEVADRIREYAALGVDEFILSGWPHLEEAYRVGEFLLPRLASVAVPA
ncbi:alkanesulfonate monooxygenase [Asanoa ishikariensis]|uniref:Alkanesulfonate monooxygenase n=1 Tax=Asanoa ishikariensis TaxID=137265 RepID=A0A1H3NXD6_9ACTN|nr:LLM class flavin-dependent oxidoreductase [Asanoa ishikariensis]GIF68282.1 alkanesulfonate monooxygenase [Asanoa ishikariensis]SDY93478.1 alkanesulfonate monooxygenase [Asanoa ishikariensis]